MSTQASPAHPLSALGGTLEQQADYIAERILALRALTAATGSRTTRAQNGILQSLPDDLLIAVALKIKGGTK